MATLSTSFLQGLVERGFQATQFLREIIGGTGETTHSTAKIDFDSISDSHQIAPYIKRGDNATTVTNQGFQTNSYQPPLIMVETPINPKDLEIKAPGRNEYDSADLSRIGEMLIKANRNKEAMIQRAEELQYAELMQSGAITVRDVNGNALGDAIDYQRNAALTTALTGGDRWDQSGSDPIELLEGFIRTMNSKNGNTPTKLILGINSGAAFMGNAKVQEKADILRGQMDAAFNREWIEKFKARKVFDNAAGMEVWIYNGFYRNSAGEIVYYVPENGAILVNPADFENHYGGVTEIVQDENGERTEMIAAKRIMDIRVNKDIKQTVARIESAPLAIALNPNSSMYVQVIS